MAARRLLIVMLILLGLSTLAAALVPPQSLREGTTTTTTETTEPAVVDTVPKGEDLCVNIGVGGNQIPVVPMEVGDQLALKINSNRADQLDIPRLGLVQAVTPDEPARFDILADEPGSFGIRFVEADKLAARIQVNPASKTGKEEATPPAPGGSCRP